MTNLEKEILKICIKALEDTLDSAVSPEKADEIVRSISKPLNYA